MDNKKTIAENIKLFRKQKLLTQSDIAEIIEKDRSTIAKYENGQAEPPFSVLRILSKLFDVTIDELCGIAPASALSVRSDDSEQDNDLLSNFTKEEQIIIYKLKVMDEEKKKTFMKIFKDFIKDE